MREKDRDYICAYLPKEKLEEGLNLLEKGICPQYIVGNVNFYGNEIDVNSSVLIPRFETELLVEKTLGYVNKLFCNDGHDLDVLDIGTGSGCIAITLKKELGCRVIGADISKGALVVARQNAVKNEADVTFVESDIFSNIIGNFDVMISNPPYIREEEEIEEIVKNNEPHLALYAKENGLYFYRKILEDAGNYLKHKFLIAFEIGELQGEEVKRLAYQSLSDVEVIVEKDYSDRDRFVFILSR